jgi:hypothetical protein
MAHSNAPMFGVGERGRGFFLQRLGHMWYVCCGSGLTTTCRLTCGVLTLSSLPVSVSLSLRV